MIGSLICASNTGAMDSDDGSDTTKGRSWNKMGCKYPSRQRWSLYRETQGKYNDLQVVVPQNASHQIQDGVDLPYTLS